MSATIYDLTEGLRALSSQRLALKSLRAAATAMTKANLDTRGARESLEALESNVLTIATPCMFCDSKVLGNYRVDDPLNSFPNNAICGECSERIDAECDVEIEEEAKANDD